MSKLKYVVVIILLMLISGYIFNSNKENNNEEVLTITKQPLTKKNVDKVLKKKHNKNKKTTDQFSKSEVFELLKPPKDRELEYVWNDEYGCYDPREDPEEACQYDFLNAKSLKEAKWMKNNGYPTKSMLNLVNNPNYRDQIKELARNKYPAALTVASIEAIEIGNYREAAHLALSTIAYSDKSKTYPHVLYGEALVLDDKKIAGVTELFIAGLLGDPMANGRAIGLSPNTPYTVTTLNSAHNYLKNIFGLNVPNDPRPMGGDGG